jgi:TonB-dependent receptor
MKAISTGRSLRSGLGLAGISIGALAIALGGPAAAQDAPAGAPGADGGEIVVSGQRAAELASIQLKRNNDAVVETLVADDVGKLPDQNVAESVKRLPGLSVANDQGEGRYVIIRGVNPNLVNVTVNGMTQPAPEPDGRQVKLDDIPSALIAAVTVSKSLTADQDANAIGGAVDIKTLSAFDRREHFFATARGQVGRYDLNGKHPWEFDAQIGGRTDTFGAVLSVSKSRRPIESENFQASEEFYPDNDGPDQFGLRDYNLIRDRLGVVLNLDYQPTTAVKLYLRGTYSKFGDDEYRDQNRVDNIEYTPASASSGDYTGRGAILIRRRIEKDNTKSISGGGSFLIGASTLDLNGSWAKAVKNDPLRSEYSFQTKSSTAVSGAFDLDQSPYGFTFDAPFDPTIYPLKSVNYDHRHAQEKLWQARADFTVPIAVGDDSIIKVGAKYLNRNKTNDRAYEKYSLASGHTFNASDASYIGDTGFYGGMYEFGPRVDYYGAEDFLADHPGTLTQMSGDVDSSVANSLANDYDVTEKVTAGYVMAKFKWGGLTVTPGVRVERTSDDAAGKLIVAGSTVDDGFNSFSSRSYTDWFPGVNVKFEAADNLVLRAAATTSLGRPNYPDLAPFISVDDTTSPPTVTKGNPDIAPYKAVNLDATLEYYLADQGVLSVGVFYKRIDNPIYTQTQAVTNYTIAGQTFADANVIQPLNADEAVLKGIEFNAQYQFTFLPGFLSGFGVGGNLTFVGGHGSGLLGRSGDFPLFFQSKTIGSAQLTYEKYGFTGRLAYSYRSKYLDLLGSDAATDEYTDNNGQLDARLGYDFNDNFGIYAEAVNLNDAPWRRFKGSSSFLVEREHYGPSYRVGAQIKF